MKTHSANLRHPLLNIDTKRSQEADEKYLPEISLEEIVIDTSLKTEYHRIIHHNEAKQLDAMQDPELIIAEEKAELDKTTSLLTWGINQRKLFVILPMGLIMVAGGIFLYQNATIAYPTFKDNFPQLLQDKLSPVVDQVNRLFDTLSNINYGFTCKWNNGEGEFGDAGTCDQEIAGQACVYLLNGGDPGIAYPPRRYHEMTCTMWDHWYMYGKELFNCEPTLKEYCVQDDIRQNLISQLSIVLASTAINATSEIIAQANSLVEDAFYNPLSGEQGFYGLTLSLLEFAPLLIIWLTLFYKIFSNCNAERQLAPFDLDSNQKLIVNTTAVQYNLATRGLSYHDMRDPLLEPLPLQLKLMQSYPSPWDDIRIVSLRNNEIRQYLLNCWDYVIDYLDPENIFINNNIEPPIMSDIANLVLISDQIFLSYLGGARELTRSFTHLAYAQHLDHEISVAMNDAKLGAVKAATSLSVSVEDIAKLSDEKKQRLLREKRHCSKQFRQMQYQLRPMSDDLKLENGILYVAEDKGQLMYSVRSPSGKIIRNATIPKDQYLIPQPFNLNTLDLFKILKITDMRRHTFHTDSFIATLSQRFFQRRDKIAAIAEESITKQFSYRR